MRGSDEVQGLWRRFSAAPQADLRELLVGHYLPLARIVAARLYSARLDNSVPFDDYLQYARIGLLEAIDRYDPNREASFETFSTYRIRGAILNGLGKESEVAAQRSHWRAHAAERFESLRAAASPDVAQSELEHFVQLTVTVALAILLGPDEEPTDHSVRANPYAATELSQLRQLTRSLVDRLPDRERSVVRDHYFEYREFQVIARDLGVTKGRISQLHAQALWRLRELLNQACSLDSSL